MIPSYIFKKSRIALMTIFALSLTNCEKKVKEAKPKITKQEKYIVTNIKPQPVPDTINQETNKTIKTDVAKVPQIKNQPITVKETKPSTTGKTVAQNKTHPQVLPPNYKIYSNLQNILKLIQTGQTATKEELTQTKALPEDALKIVKSIRKVSDNELEIKWKSKWLVEKISDVKLKDDIIKVKFSNNLVYTSGTAIGIKYEDKVYTDLIIKGDRAFIPSVKEYSWRIGK